MNNSNLEDEIEEFCRNIDLEDSNYIDINELLFIPVDLSIEDEQLSFLEGVDRDYMRL